MINETTPLLFGPKNGKSILRSHPEIQSDPIFKELSNEEIHFAWLMGIPGSPVDEDWPNETRQKAAAAKAFKGDKYHKYAQGDFSEQLRQAIKKFSSFSVEARSNAKLTAQRIFHNWMKIANSNVEDMVYVDKDGSEKPDWTARKQYVDSTKDIYKELEPLVKKLEEGFGINEVKKTDQVMGTKPIDKFHQEKKN